MLGYRLERRDPYAHSTDYESDWCFVDDPELFKVRLEVG